MKNFFKFLLLSLIFLLILPFAAEADTYQLTSSSSQTYQFGGFYSSGSGVNPSFNDNPITGTAGCPLGYLNAIAFENTGNTMEIHMCYVSPTSTPATYLTGVTLTDTGSDSSSTASCEGNSYFAEIFGNAIATPNCNVDIVDNPTLDWFMGLLVFLLSAFGIVWFFRRR